MSVMASSSFQPRKYHVFLNFYGKNTRLTFTSYLYYALLYKGIQVYMDSEDLESGKEISPTLSEAIEESKIAVIIFSENYGSSSWCLDELLHIMQRKDNTDLVVIPIFYHIDPSTVRWQNGTFGDGFDKLKKYHNEDKMDTWRKALKNAADISGSHRTQSYSSESEPKLIKKIVGDILKKLERTSFNNCDIEDLIGIDTRFEQLKSLLCIDSSDVHLTGVWGMGGLGKTTLAHILYERLKSQFHVHCFLLNIRETLEKQGQNYLENKFYSQLFNENNPKFGRERLRYLKSLIVLDDVDDIRQMTYLSGMVKQGMVGSGSRIIVTTRNKEVLGKANHIYTLPELDLDESYQLFLLHAFNGGKPSKKFEVVLLEVVHYAKGIPLALIILGSFLCDLSIEEWYSALKKLKDYSKDEIDAVLRISYDGLDQMEKDIFLDIACFFVGEDKDSVEEILNACELYANLGISVLRKRSLISIDQNNILQVHDLVCGMAHKIALQENTEKHGKHKRIFRMDDVQNVLLQDNQGVATIRGIILNNYWSKKLVLSETCFSKMSDLRFLKFYDPSYQFYNVKLSHCNCKVDLPERIATLPSELVYLHWVGYKSNKMPKMFNPINLVELKMPYSLLKRLCFEVQLLVKLRKVDLSYSTKLIEISGLSKARNLKVVNLEGCESLCELPLSFKNVCKITSLNLNGCKKLWSLNINHLEPPKNLKHLTSLRELRMRNASIEIVPSSIECLSSLVELDLSNCSRLKSLPTSIHGLTSLEKFYLKWCTNLEKFPEILEPMESLKVLDLTGTGIKKLCMSIGKLVGLHSLILAGCLNLRSIPDCILHLNCLKKFYVTCFLNPEKLPSFPLGLGYLGVEDCKAIRSISELPPNLVWFDARSCALLKTIDSSTTTNFSQILDGETFEVDNCPKSEHGFLWAEARVKVLSLSRITPKVKYQQCTDVQMRWSGNEIPEWMTYRNNWGSSITIDLPSNWQDPNFLGFAFCIVKRSNHFYEVEDERILCATFFSNVFGIKSRVMLVECCFSSTKENIDIVFFYTVTLSLQGKVNEAYWNKHWINGNKFNQATFHFYYYKGHRSDSDLIKKCGVHMLFRHEAKKCDLMNNRNTLKPTTSSKRCRDDFDDNNDENDEEEKKRKTQKP